MKAWLSSIPVLFHPSSLIPHPCLICFAAQEHGQRAQHDLEVEPERPVLYVEEVEANHLVERESVAARHLPESRHARLHVEPLAVPEFVRLDLVRYGRARADEAHVAAKDVEKLRQLVQARAAEPATGARHARVVVEFVDGPPTVAHVRVGTAFDVAPLVLSVFAVVRARAHRSELEEEEYATVHPDALLPVEHGAARVQLDEERHQNPQRREEDERDRRDEDVRGALHYSRALSEGLAEERDDGEHADLVNLCLARQAVEEAGRDAELDSAPAAHP